MNATWSLVPASVCFVDFRVVDGATEAKWWRLLAYHVHHHGGMLLHHIACVNAPEAVRVAMFSRLAAHIRLMDESMTDNDARVYAALFLAEESEDAP